MAENPYESYGMVRFKRNLFHGCRIEPSSEMNFGRRGWMYYLQIRFGGVEMIVGAFANEAFANNVALLVNEAVRQDFIGKANTPSPVAQITTVRIFKKDDL
jgi:hypothetical protein